MGPRFISAEGNANGSSYIYAINLQWGRASSARKAPTRIPGGIARGPSMGPRFISAEGEATASKRTPRASPSMGPRFISAEGGVEKDGVGIAAMPSMGPRFISAEGTIYVTETATHMALQWGRASSARKAVYT